MATMSLTSGVMMLPTKVSSQPKNSGSGFTRDSSAQIGWTSSSLLPTSLSRHTKSTVLSKPRSTSSRVTVPVSILEATRTDHQGKLGESSYNNVAKTSLNPSEVLLEKFANSPPPLETSETEAADRLFLWDDVPKIEKKQVFSVYELNEFNRDSPAVLEFSRQTVNKLDPDTGAHIHALGDQVQFTNTLYNGSLKMRLGITAGICLLMKHYPGQGTPDMHKLPFFVPDHYETIMTWHFGDLGIVSGQGPFVNFQDTLMSVTGGTGFFAEARGVIRLHNLTPFKFFYTFHLRGVPELPKLLSGELVKPTIEVTSHPDAAACKPGHTLPNYTH